MWQGVGFHLEPPGEETLKARQCAHFGQCAQQISPLWTELRKLFTGFSVSGDGQPDQVSGAARRAADAPLPAAPAAPLPARVQPGAGARVPAHPEVRQVQEPRRGVGAEGPQALLPLAGLRVRKVHADRGEAARHGRAGGAAAAAGSGGERGAGPAPAVPGIRGGCVRREPSEVTRGPRCPGILQQLRNRAMF